MHSSTTPPFLSRISTKILASFFVIVISAGIAFYFINQDFSQKTLEQVIKEEVKNARTSFKNLQENNTTVLTSTLAAIKKDSMIREIYKSNDRERLYEYVSPLFAELRSNYNITHWYFILPDGTVFLRMHQKEVYGDTIQRATFIRARDTKGFTSGIELGKAEYVLRAVTPYYDERGELIGYLELANEIGHSFSVLEKETDDIYAVVADKKYLNRENWRSVREAAGLQDNWDSLGEEHLLVVGDVIEKSMSSVCFSEENIEEAEGGKNIFQRIEEGGEVYQCIGFSFDDASGQHSGSVFALLNITDHVAFLAQTQRTVAVALALLLIISALIGWVITRYLSRPIKRLSRIAEVIAGGDFDVRADITTRDEVGQLSHNFNVMTEKLIEIRRYPESIIRSMADSLILVGNDGNIKEVNQAAIDLLGYQKEELLGAPLEKIVIPSSSGNLRGTLLDNILTETETSGVCTMDGTFTAKDGTHIPLGVSCSIMRDENHAVVGVVMVGKDIRAVRAAEEKSKESEQSLRVANRDLEDSRRQLEMKIAELEKFNKLVVGRELKMAELKKENEELKKRLGEGGTRE